MDLHGCYSDWITPHVYYTGVAADEVVEIAREAARCVSVGYMVKSVATTGAYNHAGVNGIPGILLKEAIAIFSLMTMLSYIRRMLSMY